jgi:F420-dependent oxidoreductase-like protein
MKLGIPLGWPATTEAIGPEVARVARAADQAGLDSLWTTDHLFQIPVTGLPRTSPMLEGHATIGYLAGQTSRIGLGVMVTCPVYRHPGMLVKEVTSLDVLSGGRLTFGIGVGWDVEEATSLGIPFPPVDERYERLEDVLRLARQMWAGDESPFAGRHVHLPRPLNSPNALQRPHPPILIGGSGERRTLLLVARYGDACNLLDLADPYRIDLRRKLDVLAAHCEAVGRDPATISRTVLTRLDAGDRGGRRLVDRIGELAELGFDHAIVMAPTFEWGPELDDVLALVEPVHAIEGHAVAA